MAKTKIEVELTQAQEIALMNRYGRGCSPETLAERAIAEVVTLKTPWVKPVRVKRKADEPVCICGLNDGKLVSPDCPVPSHAADAAAQLRLDNVDFKLDQEEAESQETR